MVVLPLSSQLRIQAAYKAADLDGAQLHLFKNDFVPNIATVLGDLVEADFSGYAFATILLWGEPYVGPGNRVEADGPSQQFNHSGGAVANDVYGWFLLDTTAVFLLALERFVNGPYTLSDASHSVITLPRWAVDAPLDLDSFAQ